MNTITIGRSPNNSIVLQSQLVSASHATLSIGSSGAQITDQRSSNGTFVNGVKIADAKIYIGDVVHFGDTPMTFDGQTLIHGVKKSNSKGAFLKMPVGRRNAAILGVPLAVAFGIASLVAVSTDSPRSENQATHDYFSPPANIEDLIEEVKDATYQVECETTRFISQGSGFGVDLGGGDPRQRVVTNNHVVELCGIGGEVSVLGRGYYSVGKVVALDADNDLAIIDVERPVNTMGVSPIPKAGYWSMAVGSPSGQAGTVNVGAVTNYFPNGSTLDPILENIDDLVMTDTAINRGNSGGPLVDSMGNLIGINTFGFAAFGFEGTNFAVGWPNLCIKVLPCRTDRW